MGMLQDGKWVDQWYDTKKSDGRFVRSAPQFRNWITKDGAPGPSGEGGFAAEPGRYHLYVSFACPWAHRTLIFRALKGLENHITVSVVDWYMAENGWTFETRDGIGGDSENGKSFLHQIYTLANADYSGRVTVPILWDKHQKTIVSNESSEIIRMLNSEFDDVGAIPGDYYPEPFRAEIDQLNERIYGSINNGVYKAGFATSQQAYEEAVQPLFENLDWLEEHLKHRRYLAGENLTEADWRLFTTLVRFDPVYFGHFKCNLRRLSDYPNLWNYVRELYQYPNIAATVNLEHIKNHYYASHETVNPARIIPVGWGADLNEPHTRDAL